MKSSAVVDALPLAKLDHNETVSGWDKFLVLLLVLIPLGATAFAMYAAWNWTHYLTLKDLALLGVFYLITSLGITVGYHRMLTHGGFDAPWFVRAALLIAGAAALEGSPISWTAVHLKHHAYSDKDGDPHSPIEGLLHAHVGWLFSTRVDPKKYAPRQLADPVARFVARTTGWWSLLFIVLPFLIGGWTGLLWGAGVRIFLVHHVTWSVNSICHTFGTRAFKNGKDRSRNNPIVGILAMGEGWHNNHHAFPRSAFHGLRWREPDAAGLFIRLLGVLHLARNIYHVPGEMIAARRLQSAKGQDVVVEEHIAA